MTNVSGKVSNQAAILSSNGRPAFMVPGRPDEEKAVAALKEIYIEYGLSLRTWYL